jgi:acyl transferase domain-containing protein/NADPH:quinone reductase-like Zn-dependent oxidoreductase/acyl carrier protein
VPLVLDERASARLCGVLAGCGEDQVAIRAAGVMARRLVRAPRPVDAAGAWVPGGTVLVTGGTGAIGAHVARWLAGRGAPRVVLASRSGPAAFGAAGLVAGLAAAGVGAEVVVCDVAQRAQASGLLDRIAVAGPPLAAVLHAAGLVQDTALADTTTAELAAVVAAKASGAAYLDELTAGLDLEQFVLFSSIAATWGSGGQPGYAAANAFLDALAENRRARGLAATSVAWGPWDGGGMTDEEGADQLQRRGLTQMDPRLAVKALGQVLDGAETLVTVADVDWARFAPPFTVRRSSPLIEGLPEVRQILADISGDSGSAVPGAGSALGRELAGLPGTEQARRLVTLVRAEAAAVLGHRSAEAVPAGRAFKELGFDSLTAVELRRRLSVATGLRLPATLVFDYPSPAAVAEFMRAEVLGTQAPATAPAAAAAPYGEPIAIVGMSCRLPGGVTDPEALWDLVASGTDAISGFPADRGWDTAGLPGTDPGDPGTSYARQGGFVADAAEFDAGFFGISPREALAMDPQQRMLLETSWEALERAGIDPGSLRGSRTGVFAGAAHSGYGAGLEEEGTGAEGYLLTGGLTAVISGRVSYVLGLEGPAVTVDTACSSALVALHLACQALRSGECTLALAGGVAVMATPTAFAEFSRQQGLAADGRCKSFSATADGTGWAEGAGMLVLERLCDARRNGHQVLAVVRGTAVNQDGASNGLTAPNGPSQQRVIRAALASAQLRADQVDAVEAHGTGTVLGDPIEAQALIATYGQDRPQDRPLWLGSVKSNIGHTQAAAGVAGVIKMVLALQHGLLPPTLHAGEPSPHVDWSAGDVRLLTELVPWPAHGQPRRAGISAFGISGTNAHAIVEDAPAAEVARTPEDGGTTAGMSQLAGPSAAPAAAPGLVSGATSWLLSGRTAAGLAAQAARLAAHLTSSPDLDPADVAWSLAVTRSVFEHRAVITGADRTQLATGLAAVAAGEPAAGVLAGTVPAAGAGRLVFVFPGQGGQWLGMGRELAASSPVFAARLAECGQALAPHVDWNLAEVLTGTAGAPGLDRADVVQPVLWAVMVSLAATWQAAGITPDAVAGHSQGEIAAACVAGILSLEDGAMVVALRSRALMALAGQGGMLSVAEPIATVRDRLASWADRLSVAAVNGPAATVVSGEVAALHELAAACTDDGVRTRLLPVDYASHHIGVEGLRSQILADLARITPGPGQVPMISAMTGEFLGGPEAGAEYWYASLRAPVDFDRAVRVLTAGGHQVFIEVSPHPVLTAAITATVEDAAAAGLPGTGGGLAPVVTGTLRRDDGGPDRFLTSLAHVHVHGTVVNWSAVLGGGRQVELPTYAFQHQRFWARPARVAGDVTAAGLGAVNHPLLGAAVELAGGEGLLFTGLVSVQSQPWLADHAVSGTVLLPGTAFVELAVRAGDTAGCGRVQELALEAPLVLPADGAVQLQVVLGGPDQLGQRPVEVYARPADNGPQVPWTRHASGLLAQGRPAAGLAEPDDFAAWPPQGAVLLETGGLYEGLAAGGYGYGPAFRGLRAAWRRGDEVFAEIALPPGATTDAGAFGLHPALLDAALHAAGLAGVCGQPGEIMLPFAWTGVTLHAAGASVLRARLCLDDAGALSLTAADSAGTPVISVEAVVFLPVPAGQLQSAADGLRDALFSVEWVQVTATSGGPAGDRWAVIGDDPFGLTAGLAAAGTQVRAYPDLAALATAAGTGEPVPQVILTCAGDGPAAEPAAADGGAGEGQAGTVAASARAAAGQVLALVQGWLTDDRLSTTRLVVVTRGAVAAAPGEGVADLAGAAVRGLVRSAQSENPGRLVLADLPAAGSPGDVQTAGVLASVLGSGEPELAIREGAAYGRRLARPSGGLVPPSDGGPWRLDVIEPGTLDGLALVPCPQAAAPLHAGEVRIAVRAAGLNFRDVLISLDMYPGTAVMGGEIAGIVIGTGPGVTGLETGDRVLGLAAGGFGPVAVTDARLVTQIPAGWSWVRAAAVPVALTTAWYALADLATARPGQKLLVHAAAGGVGMAAVTIARHLGLEVYGTASPGKHGVLAAMGLDAAHIASSRTADFEQQILTATGGAGVDIVLNALAGELTDASLRLLPRGGTFIEMGKTDLRDAGQVARQHPGVTYRAFETGEAGPERLAQILDQVTGLLAGGQLAMPPVRAWDVRQAREAFRFMSQARHAGKIVLTIPPRPRAPRAAGTVLVTGGTGLLGGLVARHLASTGRARNVLLASRSGPAAPGAAGLVADLARNGTGVQVAACDAGDRAALAGLLAAVPADSPLTMVVHAAGVIDDGVTGSLTPARVDAVMRPKADAAWHLHELTRGMDLDAFVLFSAAAATFGGAGQGNYAAANAFLDGLASYRRAAGLPAISLAWGLWATASAMTGHLGSSERARIGRGGMIALTAETGLALLDAAVDRDEAQLVAARLDVAGLRARAAQGQDVPPLWRGLVGGVARPAAAAAAGADADAADGLRRRLAGLPVADRDTLLLDLVRAHAAAVIGHASAEGVEPDRSFRELGFDSLTAVELRNRLNAATGLQLPATLVFDYPTPAVLCQYLLAQTSDQVTEYPPIMAELDKLESALSGIAEKGDEKSRVIMRLEALVRDLRTGTTNNVSTYHEIDEATDEQIFDLLDKELES